MNAKHIAAPMPGKVLEVKVKQGKKVDQGNATIVMEAMKMEYVITARESGEMDRILVQVGDQVEEGDLLATLV